MTGLCQLSCGQLRSPKVLDLYLHYEYQPTLSLTLNKSSSWDASSCVTQLFLLQLYILQQLC